MWEFLNQYFNFTKKERKGILFLILIIALFIVAPYSFSLLEKDAVTDNSGFEKELAQLKIIIPEEKNYPKTHFSDQPGQQMAVETTLFHFDPNTATVEDWIQLGIRKRTAETIQKYISKGGKFYKPEDLKKIYGLSERDAQRLIPYVSIQSLPKDFRKESNTVYQKEAVFPKKTYEYPLDINRADTTAFISLPGIGSGLSRRIIAFREKLGGFYSIDQVGETYFLPDSTFQKIKPLLKVNSNDIKKINLNACTVEELKAHPYINYPYAKAIIAFRTQHGNFSSIDEIKKIMIVDDVFYKKVSEYFTVD